MLNNRLPLFMMLLTTLILTAQQAAFSQRIFTIDSLSAKYYAKVKIAECDADGYCKGAGWVRVYDRKSGKMLINLASEDLALWLHDSKVTANVIELPYGEQSVIIYNDFNFDGLKDFAIQDGQNSCYSGPSFQVFLAQGNSFKYNADFTRLAQEYCGMFEVNAQTKHLSTMTKSGCCWHQYSDFVVENNKPKAVHIVEEDAMIFPYQETTEQVWKNGKMVSTVSRTIDFSGNGIKPLLSFSLEKSGKKVALFMNESSLNYVLMKPDGEIEMAYPLDAADAENTGFTYDSTSAGQTLTFTNKQAKYTVFEHNGDAGIMVEINNKSYYMPGKPGSREGSLQEVLQAKAENVK
ncbi:MAG TPA: hypothetical protein VGD35_07565 [Chitinophaga sp.]